MSCDKGYKNQCCCECKLQLEIRICTCGKCPTIKGYICLLPNDIENDGYCYYKEKRHGSCECFIKKESLKSKNRKKVGGYLHSLVRRKPAYFVAITFAILLSPIAGVVLGILSLIIEPIKFVRYAHNKWHASA